ncbi:MAG: hypothetical protein P8N49_00105 [Opitutales bacterium]|nr:hypothetical protein [Opitutales bacterium]
MSDFKVCKNCDFEWHLLDGSDCPVCTADDPVPIKTGGVFGTGKHALAWAIFFKALGLILLVYIIWAFMLSG